MDPRDKAKELIHVFGFYLALRVVEEILKSKPFKEIEEFYKEVSYAIHNIHREVEYSHR